MTTTTMLMSMELKECATIPPPTLKLTSLNGINLSDSFHTLDLGKKEDMGIIQIRVTLLIESER